MVFLTLRLPNLSRDNISLYILPIVWFTGIAIPKTIGHAMYTKATGRDEDLVNPRFFAQTVSTDASLDEATRNKILRCEAALTNHHENFPIIVGAVAAGNAAGLSPKLLNGLTLAYFASRIAHSLIYIWHDTYQKAFLRTISFFTGVAIWTTLLVKAGQKFSKTALGR